MERDYIMRGMWILLVVATYLCHQIHRTGVFPVSLASSKSDHDTNRYDTYPSLDKGEHNPRFSDRVLPGQCRIMEKIETVCNGPCGRLTALCPKAHRVAIRDAVYRVQQKTSNCTAFPGCDHPDQDVCCEPTPADCVFPYSPTHLKALLRNCSGNANCLIQTERSEVETVACSTTNPDNLSSQTALNYVCVNDDVIVDICSRQESIVQGKTLFAMLNPIGAKKPPHRSVCTCLAESTQWPTTNSIAVFLVDMRLNSVMSRECAGASLEVRSGNNVKKLDCDSSRDPRINFPFVAVLNDSNVATLRLEINQNLPEFLWFGFEANEEEDIRLSCKLQGFLSSHVTTRASTNGGNPNNQEVTPPTRGVDGITIVKESKQERADGSRKKSKGKRSNVAALVVGMIVGLLLVLLLATVVAFLVVRWKHKQEATDSCDLTDPDPEVYYSTTDDEVRNFASSKTDTDVNQDTYTCPEKVEVKIRKKTSSKKVRIISTPEFLENGGGEDYVSAMEIRERKRQSERKDLDTGNNYDHLERGEDRHSDLALDGYDQLNQKEDKPPSYSSVSGMGDGGPETFRENDLSQVNQAYEDTSGVGAEHGGAPQQGLYFELEKRVSDGDSLSYEDHYFVRNPDVKTDLETVDEHVPSFANNPRCPVTDSQPSLTYTDAISVQASTACADNATKDSTPQSSETPGSNRWQSLPIAAPRRNNIMTSRETRASQYDIAKPIQ